MNVPRPCPCGELPWLTPLTGGGYRLHCSDCDGPPCAVEARTYDETVDAWNASIDRICPHCFDGLDDDPPPDHRGEQVRHGCSEEIADVDLRLDEAPDWQKDSFEDRWAP